jgi:hypothetical protein
MSNIQDKIHNFSRKFRRKYYVVDLVDDFTYTYGTYKECIDVVNWLEECYSSGAAYAIYTRKQLTDNMLSSIHPKQSFLTEIVLNKKS